MNHIEKEVAVAGIIAGLHRVYNRSILFFLTVFVAAVPVAHIRASYDQRAGATDFVLGLAAEALHSPFAAAPDSTGRGIGADKDLVAMVRVAVVLVILGGPGREGGCGVELRACPVDSKFEVLGVPASDIAAELEVRVDFVDRLRSSLHKVMNGFRAELQP